MSKTNLYIVPAIVFNSLKRNSMQVNDLLNLDKLKNILSLEQLSITYILNTIGIKLEDKSLFTNLKNDIDDQWSNKDKDLFNIIKDRSLIDSKIIDVKNYLSLNIDNEDKEFEIIIMNNNDVFIVVFSKIFENINESTVDVINRSIVESLYNKLTFSNLASTAIFKQYFKSL